MTDGTQTAPAIETLVDVLVICSLMPQADCIVNVDRAENFFLRQLVAACGYVPNDAGSRVVEAAVGRLREGRSLIVFPEGTRSPPGGLGHLRRGPVLDVARVVEVDDFAQ